MADYTEQIVWHEVITRALTDEEKAEFVERGCEPPLYMLDGSMPEDWQEILIVTKYGVENDTNYIDCDECGNLFYLDRHGDWDDVLAWAEIPKYRRGSEVENAETK